jgi:hypothetical protein
MEAPGIHGDAKGLALEALFRPTVAQVRGLAASPVATRFAPDVLSLGSSPPAPVVNLRKR